MTVKESWHSYFLRLVDVISSRSSCSRRQIGAVLVRGKIIVSSGFNGTPFGAASCDEGGCPRCASDVESLKGYDACSCVHAETNSILLAARHGHKTEGTTLYTTSRPCVSCLKELIQAGVQHIIYKEGWIYNDQELETAYRKLARGALVRLYIYKTNRLERIV